MGDWRVTWRGLPVYGGGAPICLVMRVSGIPLSSAAQAIHAAQTHKKPSVWESSPGYAFVDWEATELPGVPRERTEQAIPPDVQAAVEELVQQREEDPGPGRYDCVEQRNIDTLIDFLRSRSAGPPPAERELAKFDSPEAKQWRADAAETIVRRAVGLPDPDGVLRTSYAGMQEWAGDVQPVEPRSAVVNRDLLEG